MSTHGCFAPSFPPVSSSSRMPQLDVEAWETDATVDEDSYYIGGAYYYVQAADDDQE